MLADAPGGAGGTLEPRRRHSVCAVRPGRADASCRGGGSSRPSDATLSADQGGHRFPSFSSDGRRFLFVSVLGRPETDGLFVGSLDSNCRRVLSTPGSRRRMRRLGYLACRRSRNSVAYPFDAARGIVSGERMPVAQPVGNDGPSWCVRRIRDRCVGVSQVSTNDDSSSGGSRRQALPALPPDEAYRLFPEIGPRGLIAVNSCRAGQLRRLVDRSGARWRRKSIHRPPGIRQRRRVVARWDPPCFCVVSQRAHGRLSCVSQPTPPPTNSCFSASEQDKAPQDWSPDGRVLLYASQDRRRLRSLGIASTLLQPAQFRAGSQKPVAIAQTTFDEIRKAFSRRPVGGPMPSNEAERYEVYDSAFSRTWGKTAGLSEWRKLTAVATRQSRVVLRLQRTVEMMAVQVNLPRQGPQSPAYPAALFATRFPSGGASLRIWSERE